MCEIRLNCHGQPPFSGTDAAANAHPHAYERLERCLAIDDKVLVPLDCALLE